MCNQGVLFDSGMNTALSGGRTSCESVLWQNLHLERQGNALSSSTKS